MFLSLSFFVESPMALTSSGRSCATGAPSFVVHSIHVHTVGRHVALCPATSLLGNIKFWRLGARGFDKEDVAVTVELETPFLFVVPLVEGE